MKETIVLVHVKIILSAVCPPLKYVNILEVLPPGETLMINNPIAI